jgi:glucose/arabinose dehydrogenase
MRSSQPLNTALATLIGLCLGLAGCEESNLPKGAATGSTPKLPAPTKSLIPTVNIATAKGWPKGASPQAATGVSAKAFAAQLDHPRRLYVLPNGMSWLPKRMLRSGRKRDKESRAGSTHGRKSELEPVYPAPIELASCAMATVTVSRRLKPSFCKVSIHHSAWRS